MVIMISKISTHNLLLNNLLWSTVTRSPELMVTVCVTYSANFGLCSFVWNFGYEGDMSVLEAVQ